MLQRLRAEIENVKKQVGWQWMGLAGAGVRISEVLVWNGLLGSSPVSTGLQGVQRPGQSRGLVIDR